MDPVELVRERFERMRGLLNERGRRLFAAAEALAIGWGGVAIVARATGLAPSTIGIGKKEVRALEELRVDPLAPTRSRRPGGGRKKTTEKDPSATMVAKLLTNLNYSLQHPLLFSCTCSLRQFSPSSRPGQRSPN